MTIARKPVRAPVGGPAIRRTKGAPDVSDVMLAMKRAAKRAREIARMYNTPVWYVNKDGDLVADWPAQRARKRRIVVYKRKHTEK